MAVGKDALMSDYADNGIDGADLGATDNYPRFLVEVADDGHADVEITEPLAFHAELAQSDEQQSGSDYRGVAWRTLTDENGYLTSDATAKVAAELARLITSETGLTLDVVHEPDRELEDLPSVGLSVRTDYRPGETVQQWTDRVGWPVIATVINVTDPGTFNCPYLFSAILYRKDEAK